MTHPDRFGLPLSLVEALRGDPSPEAGALANLLEEPAPAVRPACSRARGANPHWPAIVAGFVLAGGVGGHGFKVADLSHSDAMSGPIRAVRGGLAPAADTDPSST